MKISSDYIIREIAGETVVIPTGSAAQKFNGLINLNTVAQFICSHVEKVKDEEEMVALVLDNFDIDEDTARTDVYGFLNAVKEFGLIED